MESHSTSSTTRDPRSHLFAIISRLKSILLWRVCILSRALTALTLCKQIVSAIAMIHSCLTTEPRLVLCDTRAMSHMARLATSAANVRAPRAANHSTENTSLIALSSHCPASQIRKEDLPRSGSAGKAKNLTKDPLFETNAMTFGIGTSLWPIGSSSSLLSVARWASPTSLTGTRLVLTH